MRAKLASEVSTACLLLMAMSAAAHHSTDATYLKQEVTVEGEVLQVLIRNPHSFLQLTVKDPKTGGLVRWAVEWEGAKRLGRKGVSADSLKPGDHVIVTGQPPRESQRHMLFMTSILRPADGWKWENSALRKQFKKSVTTP
jgi:Family of unknown function (DUF6152)